jgi:hypothetical protein
MLKTCTLAALQVIVIARLYYCTVLIHAHVPLSAFSAQRTDYINVISSSYGQCSVQVVAERGKLRELDSEMLREASGAQVIHKSCTSHARVMLFVSTEDPSDRKTVLLYCTCTRTYITSINRSTAHRCAVSTSSRTVVSYISGHLINNTCTL